MYMIIRKGIGGNQWFPIENEDTSILLFVTIRSADIYLSDFDDTSNYRVISIEGVHE